MVKIRETYGLIDHENITGLSGVGVEVFAPGEKGEELFGTYLASDVVPMNARVVVRVYVTKENGSPHYNKCVEHHKAFADDLLEVLGEAGVTESSEVSIWLIDYETGKKVAEYEPSTVWANVERDEITFTVRTPVSLS